MMSKRPFQYIKVIPCRGTDRGRSSVNDAEERGRRVPAMAAEAERLRVNDFAASRRPPHAVRCVSERLVFGSIKAAADWYGLDAEKLAGSIRRGKPMGGRLFEIA